MKEVASIYEDLNVVSPPDDIEPLDTSALTDKQDDTADEGQYPAHDEVQGEEQDDQG